MSYKDVEFNKYTRFLITEAIAGFLVFGMPTIFTNLRGFIDILIINQTGYTVEPQDSHKLSQSIIKTIKNNQKSAVMANSGQKLVWELLDANNTAPTILDIYDNILGDL